MTVGRRSEAMAARLAAAARHAGLDDDGARTLDRAFRLAMGPRTRRWPDERHPATLHPGRVALILLEDLGVADPRTLAAGTLAETIDLELAVPPAAIEAALGREVRALVEQVPAPARAGEALLEALVTAEMPAQLVALAERLDHARHLHLRPRPEWEPFHRETCQTYLPVALRVHPTLARRYRWWCSRFARARM